jgi:hypothetical protein
MAVQFVAKRSQNLQVGPTFEKVTGLSEDGVVVAPMGDHGAVTKGVQGDVMLEAMSVNGYTITVSLLASSPSIQTILGLRDEFGFFQVKFEFGGTNLQGFAVVLNEGEASGAVGTKTRVITLGVAKTTGSLYGIGVPIG